MKKKILILLILIFSICLVPIKAEDSSIKSITYDVIVTDPSGVTFDGKYKDENGMDKTISVNIPQNTKVRVLREYNRNASLYGYIKYTTTIKEKIEDTSKSSTNVKPDNEIIDNSSDNKTTNSDSNNSSNNNTTESDEKKYIEKEKSVEVEGEIDLSKCRIEKGYTLEEAINLNDIRKIMIVDSNGIDLYNGPALIYGKITNIPYNTELEYNYGALKISELEDEFAWVYVEYNNQKGWIYKGLLDSGVANYKKGRLLSFSEVSIREFPNKNSKKLKSLPTDLRKSFTYIYGIMDSNNDEWYYINYKGTKGWVKSVAVGVNVEIKTNKSVKIYNRPSLDSISDNVIIPKNTELKSIYKYSKTNDAFYVEYKGNKGWIILEKDSNGKSNFEVDYLEDNVKDKLVDVENIKKEDTKSKSGIKMYQVILLLLVLIIIIAIIIIIIVKKKRRQSNDFTVNRSELNNSGDKPKVTLITRSRMGR